MCKSRKTCANPEKHVYIEKNMQWKHGYPVESLSLKGNFQKWVTQAIKNNFWPKSGHVSRNRAIPIFAVKIQSECRKKCNFLRVFKRKYFEFWRSLRSKMSSKTAVLDESLGYIQYFYGSICCTCKREVPCAVLAYKIGQTCESSNIYVEKEAKKMLWKKVLYFFWFTEEV